MKPVLRTVIDKNGGEETVFTPTAKMILYSIFRAKDPGATTTDICKRAGVDPAMPGRWAGKYGSYFTDWLEEALDAQVDDDAAVLERVGMVRAVEGNFQFWREMARTKGVIKEEQPQKGLTLNTDFTQILIAVGGNFDAARAKLLSAHRGVEYAAEPGLALPAGGEGNREPAGTGAGTSALQGGPVEVSHALGTDRRRTKQRSTVPAVSPGPASPGTDEDVAGGEEPAGP